MARQEVTYLILRLEIFRVRDLYPRAPHFPPASASIAHADLGVAAWPSSGGFCSHLVGLPTFRGV